MAKTKKRWWAPWLPVAVAITIFSVLLYAALEQSYRQALNDPQVQLAEDGALALAAGKLPVEVVPRRSSLIDLRKSLAAFVAIYDAAGQPLESSAELGGLPPRPPSGVFDYARLHGENRVTWQPEPGTRIALVVKPVPGISGWFIAAGRNMREVEKRESYLAGTVGLAAGAALLLSLGAALL
jgi:hypothetical protein